MEKQTRTPNRLVHEKSPYLLQHAYNPVDWYPWGEEAFQKAEREDKPVFLSIGYSTCHWCHVMERESFENEEAAALLNRDFVPVKVDREERPDVDAVYMDICQAMTGAGGWPLTILMTPDKRPFYAATYLPRRSRYGSLGLVELLEAMGGMWKKNRNRLLEIGGEMAVFAARREEADPALPGRELLATAVRQFVRSFDSKNGGFGRAPKFPSPHNLLFLLRWSELEQDGNARRMAEVTLVQMARGGLFDQAGGGFSRYSTDEIWLAPHFEKMLYDNALLACAYLEAFRLNGRDFFRTTAVRTLDYVLRELTGPEGNFYCGQDADSGGVEGSFYLFTPDKLKAALGPEEGERLGRWFGVTEAGNFEGKNILNLLENPDYETPPPGMGTLFERLCGYRRERAELHTDDKSLASWNALMLAALARAFRLLGEERYLTAAKRCRQFIETRLTGPDGRLFVRWRDGEAAHAGNLDDYAFTAWALLELYSAEYDVSCLRGAQRAAEWMLRLFLDEEKGGFFLTPSDGEALIGRPKDTYDGAIPSGNSAAGMVLARLARLTGDPEWQERADRQLAFLAGNSAEYPAGHSFALLAMTELLYPAGELVCALSSGPLPREVRELAEKHRLAVLVKRADNAEELAEAAPFTAAYPIPETGAAFYLCRDGACEAPVYRVEKLRGKLESK